MIITVKQESRAQSILMKLQIGRKGKGQRKIDKKLFQDITYLLGRLSKKLDYNSKTNRLWTAV